MPSILNPSAGGVDEWALEQHVNPKEAQDGYLAAREEERLVKSTVQPISNDVLDWVHSQYVEPSQSVQPASYRPSLASGRPAPRSAPGPDIRSLYRDKDEFESVISAVGHSKDPLSLDPFGSVPKLPGFNRPSIPSGRKPGRGESARMASVRQFDTIIDTAALEAGVDADYIRAMMRAESSGNPDAVSPAGAVGLMQFIPSTAREYGLRVDGEVDERRDPAKAIPAAARYFADLLARYDGNHDLAVAAYNAGPGAVDKYGGVPPYRETQNHVRVVRGYYDNFRGGK